jgi:hypothetical protein
MGMNHRRHRIAAWMACFAILLASLAPAVSHGINTFRLANANPHAHCAEHGVAAHQLPDTETGCAGTQGRHVQVAEHAGHLLQTAMPDDVSHTEHAPEGGWHFEHGPFCYTHAGSFGLTPVIFFTSPIGLSAALRPALFYRSPQPLFAWRSSQPRAPPAVS